MGLFSRRPKFEQSRETVPLFACLDQEIVDVFFVEVGDDENGNWHIVSQTDKLPVSAPVNRWVLELPSGCVETALSMDAPNDLVICAYGDNPPPEPGRHTRDIVWAQCSKPQRVDVTEQIKELSVESS